MVFIFNREELLFCLCNFSQISSTLKASLHRLPATMLQKDGMVLSPAKLAHIVLKTNKYRKMVDYWNNFLGSRIVSENGFLAFMTYDDEHHRIAIAAFPGTKDKDPMSAGLAHIAFTYNSLDDLVTAYEQRKALGIHPFWCINHGTTTSIYYQDPDGNEIETQIDNFEDPEDATKYMASKHFVENPFGVEFNPDDLANRLRAGESPESLKQRGDIGPRQMLLERSIPPPTWKPTVMAP
jgi:catechol 2,3-dioxygenase-like lactoylglutathione lyase family enzyme